MRIKRKTYQENKEKKMNKTNTKQHQKKTKQKKNNLYFQKICYISQEVCLFVSYKSVKLETSTLWNDVIYYVLFMCHSL